MRWLFMWQDEDLNMAYEIYACRAPFEARERFENDHPGMFAFAVISGDDFGVVEFHQSLDANILYEARQVIKRHRGLEQ